MEIHSHEDRYSHLQFLTERLLVRILRAWSNIDSSAAVFMCMTFLYKNVLTKKMVVQTKGRCSMVNFFSVLFHYLNLSTKFDYHILLFVSLKIIVAAFLKHWLFSWNEQFQNFIRIYFFTIMYGFILNYRLLSYPLSFLVVIFVYYYTCPIYWT